MNWGKRLFLAMAFPAAVFSAMPAEAASMDGMEAFRSAYFARMRENQDMGVRVILYGPSFRADTEFLAALRSDGGLTADGTLNWVYTNLSEGTTSRESIPVFVVRDNDRLSLYGNRGGWLREDFMGAPLWLLSDLTSHDLKELADNAETVNDVALLKSAAGQQSMRVTLDGKKLAALARTRSAARGSEAEKSFVEYLAQGLEATSPVVSWVVDAKTNDTITAYVDLTDVMHKYAQSLLEASYQGKVELSEDDKSFLSAIGYYCNLQLYVSHFGKDVKDPVLPAAAKNAPVTDKLLVDLEHEAVASSLKQ